MASAMGEATSAPARPRLRPRLRPPPLRCHAAPASPSAAASVPDAEVAPRGRRLLLLLVRVRG